MLRVHELKTNKLYLDKVALETKTFEVRKNDRCFSVGDYIILKEFDNGAFGDDYVLARIIYILNDEMYCKKDYVVFSFEIIVNNVVLDMPF